jgi:hypothetical protein
MPRHGGAAVVDSVFKRITGKFISNEPSVETRRDGIEQKVVVLKRNRRK